MKNAVFWNMTPYVSRNLAFLRMMLQLRVTANIPSSSIVFTLKMEAIRSSESIPIRATRRHLPEDGILHSARLLPIFSSTDFATLIFLSRQGRQPCTPPPPFVSPSDGVVLIYSQPPCPLFIAFYEWQGCGGGILICLQSFWGDKVLTRSQNQFAYSRTRSIDRPELVLVLCFSPK
jgi:hypothetical protein